MPNEDNKILKYNNGKKSLKAPAIIMLTKSVCLKKCTHVKIILKNLIQKKKLSTILLIINCLHIVRLI